jgi:DNA-binding XRE family transcriptional regulator
MPTLAAYPGMMQCARKREGLRICRAAWLVGVSIREYREIEAGDRMPSLETYRRISELDGWPQTFAGSAVGLERWRSSARGQTRSDHGPRNPGANPTVEWAQVESE